MEAEFVERFAKDEASAMKLLNAFNLDVLAKAEALAEKLLNDVFTIRTADIEATVVFLGFAVVVLVYFFRSLCCGCVC